MREVIVKGQDLEVIASAVLTRGGCLEFAAQGYSMYPTIRGGDAIRVQPLAPQRLKRGMVVLYRRHPNRLAAHRIIRSDDDGTSGGMIFRIRGDALGCTDERVAPDDVLGEVVRVKSGERLRNLDSASARVAGFAMIYCRALGIAIVEPRIVFRHIAARLVRWLRNLSSQPALAGGTIRNLSRRLMLVKRRVNRKT